MIITFLHVDPKQPKLTFKPLKKSKPDFDDEEEVVEEIIIPREKTERRAAGKVSICYVIGLKSWTILVSAFKHLNKTQ